MKTLFEALLQVPCGIEIHFKSRTTPSLSEPIRFLRICSPKAKVELAYKDEEDAVRRIVHYTQGDGYKYLLNPTTDENPNA